MTDLKIEKIRELLKSNAELGVAFAKHLVAFDSEFRNEVPTVRELLTGPLFDLIYNEDDVLRKSLSDGTKFEFLYRSKIAQEFAMSCPSRPDHVWEPQTTKLLLRLAETATTVVVGGAYFGDHVIPIAKKISENGGVVHAFEPNENQRAMLIRNADINHLTNVIANPDGLWDTHKTTLQLVGFDAFASPVAGEDSGSNISTVRIEDYLAESNGAPPQLIMVDLEGAEFKALLGAEKFLSLSADAAPSVVFEIHSHYVDWSNGLENTNIVLWLEALGYTVYAIRDFNANISMVDQPVELIPCRDVYLKGPPHGFNMLALKKLELIDSDFFRIVSNVSPKLLLGRDPLLHLPEGGIARRVG